MAKFLTLFCLVVALFIGGSIADTCLSAPANLGRGAGCGGPLDCQTGLFCSQEGVCVPNIKEGDDCKDAECDYGLVCKGPTDYKMCVAPVHPGQDCADSSNQSGPSCGTYNCIGGRCRGGMVGDACYEDDDCLGEMTCTARICTGVAIGATCSSDNECVIGAFCHPITNQCTSLPTSGNCTIYNTCAYGYSCINTASDAPFRTCVAVASLADGAYCSGTHDVCVNKRCFNNYCAADSPKYCQNNMCASDEVCTCGGANLMEGFGTCTANPCTKVSKAFSDCSAAHCRSNNFFNGSCIQINCEKEFNKGYFCGSASTLFVSLFSASFLALIVSFLGKHF